jgi:hypothetical protein
MDLAGDDTTALDELMAELPEKEIYPISGVSRQGVEALLDTLWSIVREEKEAAAARAAASVPAPPPPVPPHRREPAPSDDTP